ncbi:MAG: beta-ketoacyl-ACP synthase II, partial [Stellaceae bacterium]
MRRVVITGLGLVTPLGIGTETVWQRLIAGESGIRAIQDFDVTDLTAKIAGQVPRGDTGSGLFNVDDWVPPKDQRKMDDFIIFAMAAAEQAVTDSGWKPETEEDRERSGVMIGSGIGGLPDINEGALTLGEKGPRRLSPFFIPACLINLASGHVSIRYGFKGPNHAVVTACSTGAHAIGDAARLIIWDDADVMVAGGTEAAVCRLGMAGFAAARALSTAFNDEPLRASRPWDKDRDGFVMGEGAGILVLEELEHAKARGANIYAEVIGYGMSGDAYHITAPAEDGNGAFRAMRNALKRAEITPDAIDYINAHGTSTPLGDEIELNAVKRVFGDHAYQ